MSGQQPSTPSHSTFRSGLPTPSGIARRSSLARSLGSGSSPVDSPDTAYKKQSLADAIAHNDPAKYRSKGSPSSFASPGTAARDDHKDGDADSPLLVPGKLPRVGAPAAGGRTGARSETPTAGLTSGSSIPSPSTTSRLGNSPRSSANEGARSKSPLAFRSGSSLGTNTALARGYVTPKRPSDVHSRIGTAGVTPGRLSTHAAPTIASRARESAVGLSRRGRDLEIGDLVRMEGSELIGVLRHLGPVEFKPGFYAGLELTGDSVGKGKNDGSVGGVQYFACAPGNGVFCPASKVVAISDEPPKDAVARPASAMSSRSGRSSDVFDRPPSTTPARRRASTVSRPPSTTPSRSSSRASARPPSATPGSRPASSLSLSRPGSRLTGRKSMPLASTSRHNNEDDDEDDEEDLLVQRQAQSSAEYAAAAAGRITAGTRAHKLLSMTAKDLKSRQENGTARTAASPTKAQPSSPLKGTLVGSRANPSALRTPRSSMTGIPPPASSTPGLPKARKSLGGVATPRPAKGRVSMFARTPGTGASAGMPPPPSPTKEGAAQRPGSSLSVRSSSRLGSTTSYNFEGGDEGFSHDSMTVSSNSTIDRAEKLLEEMDLTPKRPTRQVKHQQSASLPGFGSPNEADDMLQRESVAEAVVPLSLYEEQMNEVEKLVLQVEELEKQNQELLKAQQARKARMSEVRANEAILEEEKAKMRAEAREREKEMEEERKVERDDEVRRRKEIESREKETKEKLDEATKALAKLQDEHTKLKGDHDNQKRDMEAKIEESAKLIDEMKSNLDAQVQKQAEGEEKEALELKIKMKDSEIESLKVSTARLESELKRERKELGGQIDELKDAGRETISLYEQRIEEVERENLDLLENMQLLEEKAQEAIGAAESRYDALVASQRASGSGQRSAGAAEIDNENLREQVSHLEDKMGKYEDQIAEAALALEKEKEHSQKRREKTSEVEASLKNEIKRLRAEVDRLVKSEQDGRERVEELHHALEESKVALERERAELEMLRADAENVGPMSGTQSAASTDRTSQHTNGTEAFESKIKALSADLSAAKEAKEQLSKSLEEARKEARKKEDDLAEVSRELRSTEKERALLRQKMEDSAMSKDETDQDAVIKSLRRALEEKTNEIATLKRTSLPVPEQVLRAKETYDSELAAKDEELRHLRNRLEQARHSARLSLVSNASVESSSNRLSTSGLAISGSPGSPSPSKDEKRASVMSNASSTHRRSSRMSINGGVAGSEASAASSANQVSGLNYLVRQLTDENVEIKAKHKLLEAQLRDELREAEQKARSLELALQGAGSDGAAGGGRQLADSLASLEQRFKESTREVERLSSRVGELEREKESEVSVLSKEVSELEALVEARIFREEELEAELERLRRKVAKGRSPQPPAAHLQPEPQQSVAAPQPAPASAPEPSAASAPASTTAAASKSAPPPQDVNEPCDDCGEVGHRFEECPYANEIF